MARSKFPKTNGAKETSGAGAQESQPNSRATEALPVTASAESNPPAESAAKADTKKTKNVKAPAPKLEAVRGEGRGTVVPINLEDEIRQLAYLLSERRGFEPGHENEDWLTAEREVRQRYRQHSA